MRNVALLVVTLALSVASARDFDVTLYQPSVVAGTQLQPGEYKLELNGTKMVLKNGGSTLECDVRVEIAGKKFDRASVRYEEANGKSLVREIRLRGTDMKLVVTEPAGSSAGSR
jgi:hypothetical protein